MGDGVVLDATGRALVVARMLCEGSTQQEIAEHFGVHRHTIMRMKDSPEVVEEIERIQAEARQAAKRAGAHLVTKAVKVWSDGLGATQGAVCEKCGDAVMVPDHAIRLRAADSVADRFGLPKTEVLEASGVTLGDKSDHELMLLTLDGAAKILDMQGHHKLAAGIRATLAPTVPYTITQGGGDE